MKAKSKSKKKVTTKTPLLDFFVAGVKYADAQLANHGKGPTSEMLIDFVWERSNAFDKNAIRVDLSVYNQTYKLGYVPRDKTHLFHWQRLAGRKVSGEIVAYWPGNPSHLALRVRAFVTGSQKPEDGTTDVNLD